MSVCAPKLAALIDRRQIEWSSTIAAPSTSDRDLPVKSGRQLATELGGRYLIRYVRRDKVTGILLGGLTDRHYVTPTPFGKRDLISWLALPQPLNTPSHYILIDPEKLERALGPRFVLGSSGGIEYIIPDGLPKEALAVQWPLEIG